MPTNYQLNLKKPSTIVEDNYTTNLKKSITRKSALPEPGTTKKSVSPSMGDFKQLPENKEVSDVTNSVDSAVAAAEKKGFTEKIFFNVTRTLVILGLGILGIVLFLKAFPAVGDAAEKAASIVPVGRVASVAKKAGSVAKGLKTVKKVV